MPTKITVVYDNPEDPHAFEARYPDQLSLAKQLPGLERLESAKVWPKEDGSPTPAFRVLELYFAGYDEASAAVTSASASSLLEQIFATATGGVQILFADIERS